MIETMAAQTRSVGMRILMKSFIPLLAAPVVLLVAAACGAEATATPTAEPTLASPAVQVVLPVSSETAAISQGPTDASQPPDSPAQPAGSSGFTQYVFEEVGGDVVTILVEGPRGEQVRVPISYLELKQLQAGGEPPPEELGMSKAELARLVSQLDTVREATEKYRDIAVAMADGYEQLGGDVPNMGAHFVNRQLVEDGVFDPSQPEMVLYNQDASGDWELVGTAFILPHQDVGQDHPEAFAGPLDNWHVHYNLCRSPTGRFSSTTAEECDTDGGHWESSYGWMLHAYVWVDNPLGVFQMWNSNLPPVSSADEIRSRNINVPPGTVALSIQQFSHQEARIMVGQTVAWTNADGVPHTVTSGSRGEAEKGFDSGNIATGQSFALRFDQPGEYPYTCTLHPNMNGTVTVVEPITLDPKIYDAYVGQYEVASLGVLTVTKENDRLFVHPNGESKAELFPESETQFFLPEFGAQTVFIKNDKGEVTGLVVHFGGQDYPGTKIR